MKNRWIALYVENEVDNDRCVLMCHCFIQRRCDLIRVRDTDPVRPVALRKFYKIRFIRRARGIRSLAVRRTALSFSDAGDLITFSVEKLLLWRTIPR